jgi:hypothetical protein
MPTSIADGEIIEALRGVGGIKVIFEVEFPNRRTAIKELTAEFEWRGFGEDWWEENLAVYRGH